jgi:hypothetical protein
MSNASTPLPTKPALPYPKRKVDFGEDILENIIRIKI